MELAAAMALAAATWAAGIAVFWGIGFLVDQLFRGGISRTGLPLARMWVGVCAVPAVLQCIHFEWAMSAWVGWAIAIAGAAGLAWGIGAGAVKLPRNVSGVWIAVAVAALWLANRGAGSSWMPYDTGFYHASTLKWYASYAVVPGLANLHPPLALNAASLLLGAAVDSAFWPERAQHVLCGLWAVMYLVWFSAEVEAARKSAKWGVVMFVAAGVPVVLAWGLSSAIAGLSTDPAAIVLAFVCVAACLRVLVERRGDLLGYAALAGATAIACKLIALVVVVLALGVTVAILWRRGEWRGWKWAAAAMVLVLGPWMARNVVMSGYAVNPVPWTAVNVPWRLPTELAADQQAWIRSWSRVQGVPLSATEGAKWIRPWWEDVERTHWGDLLAPLVLAGVAMALGRKEERAGWVLIVAPIGALAFWFWNAPDVRYAAYLAAMTLGILGAPVARGKKAKWAAGLVAVYAGVLLAQQTAEFMRVFPQVSPRVLFAYLPGDDEFMEKMRKPDCVLVKTESGVGIWVPREQARQGPRREIGEFRRGENRIWGATLPAGPYPVPELKLRKEGDLGSGFEMEKR